MRPTAEMGTEPSFDIAEPKGDAALAIFSSPHSGTRYPVAFLQQARLELSALRRSEDVFVDELFAAAPMHGCPLIRALFPRSLLDLNREPYELDPRMFDGPVPSFANTRSLRVAGGLGTVPRVAGDQMEIYGKRLPIAEAIGRIETLYKPYHRALRRLLLRTQRHSGVAILVDCHSMPSRGSAREDRPRADIVLGDRFGASCAPAVTDVLESTLRKLGYGVARNRPYAGGYITEHYGAPANGIHAVQIEINRALYMDEGHHCRIPHFTRVQRDMESVIRAVTELAPEQLYGLPAAAE